MRMSSTNHLRSSLVDGRVYHKGCFVQQAVRSTVDDVTFVINQDEVASVNEREMSSEWVNLVCED